MGCLEYDLRTCCGVDVRGLFSEPQQLTWRQVWVWLRHLPEDSALGRRGEAGDRKPGLTHRLTAQLINELRILDYHLLAVNTDDKGRKKMPQPDMIDLEGDDDG